MSELLDKANEDILDVLRRCLLLVDELANPSRGLNYVPAEMLELGHDIAVCIWWLERLAQTKNKG